jgi:hypothetical protein
MFFLFFFFFQKHFHCPTAFTIWRCCGATFGSLDNCNLNRFDFSKHLLHVFIINNGLLPQSYISLAGPAYKAPDRDELREQLADNAGILFFFPPKFHSIFSLIKLILLLHCFTFLRYLIIYFICLICLYHVFMF